MRTLKLEEVYLNEYDTLAEVLASIQHFIEAVYNRKRLHSAIGYRPPAEFKASLSPPKLLNCLRNFRVHYKRITPRA